MWRPAWKYLKTVHEQFEANGGNSSAAAISFFAMLSLAPFSLFIVAALSYLIQDEATVMQQIEGAVAHMMPGAGGARAAREILTQTGMSNQVNNLIELRGWAATVGLATLLWSASRIFANAAPPLNRAFSATETRSFFQVQAVAVGMLFRIGVLFLLSLALSAVPALLPRIPPLHWLPDIYESFLAALALFISISLNSLIFATIYRYLPSPTANVGWRQALAGGGAVAIAWEVLKQIFALYLSQFGESSYGKVYGSLGGLFVLILWIYYSSVLLIYGAQIARMYGDEHPESVGDGKEAIKAMAEVEAREEAEAEVKRVEKEAELATAAERKPATEPEQ